MSMSMMELHEILIRQLNVVNLIFFNYTSIAENEGIKFKNIILSWKFVNKRKIIHQAEESKLFTFLNGKTMEKTFSLKNYLEMQLLPKRWNSLHFHEKLYLYFSACFMFLRFPNPSGVKEVVQLREVLHFIKSLEI